MKKLSIILLLGLFSCEDNLLGENYYIVSQITQLEDTTVRKYKVTLKINTNLVAYSDKYLYTDSLYSVGDSIKIGK